MTVHATVDPQPVARKKSDKRRAETPPTRYELRLESETLERIRRQADRRGSTIADWMRWAITAYLEADEATDPELRD